jgi:hypothetical protein
MRSLIAMFRKCKKSESNFLIVLMKFLVYRCVIASDTLVKGIFDQNNCLIGGNPARILKENIKWK